MSLLEKLAIHFLTKGKKNITYKGTRVNRAATMYKNLDSATMEVGYPTPSYD